MKKNIALILAVICILSSVFVACNDKGNKGATNSGTEKGGLEDVGDEFIYESEEVTDKDGKSVTDKNGDVVTTMVVYRKDKNSKSKGKETFIKQDESGNDVTDKNGKVVTTKVKVTTTDEGAQGNEPSRPKTTKPKKTTVIPTEENAETTEKELTTLKLQDDVVPKTSAKGKKVTFSAKDQQTIKSMLEVPYLYCASYENRDGIPTNMAAHVAMWMADREGLNTTEYASGTIVLDLFRYFAQTVVNFKTDCNKGKDPKSSITYNATNDTFKITAFEAPTHTVKLTRIEKLGNNNYYKVYANVSGIGAKEKNIDKVVAVIQRNQIDSSLGFSIKALKWS